MALSINHADTKQKVGPSKMVVGVLVAAMTAFVGLTGVAGATSGGGPSGSGYGGNVNANVETNVNLTVNGNNNVINVVIHYIFGG